MGEVGKNIQSAIAGRLRVEYDNNRIVLVNAANNKTTLLIGPDSTGTDVIKMAKSGFDAVTATNDQLIFNSGQNVFKINKTLDMTVGDFGMATGAGLWGSTTFNITKAHGLDYVPQIIPYGYIFGAYWAFPIMFNTAPTTGSVIFTKISAAADATNVILNCTMTCFNVDNTQTGFPVKVYLLQETAN